MDIPGLSDERQTTDKAGREAERVLEELKQQARVEVQDIGTLRKELRITVPAGVIAGHLAHNYQELRQEALVPGFRKGRAPLKLIEKRFGPDVRDSAKTTILGQAYLAVVEKQELTVLGDPLFRVSLEEGVRLMDLEQARDHVKLPDNEDFVFVCEVETKPQFELPPLEGIEIRPPRIEITEADVEREIQRRRKILGRYEPVSEGAAQGDDLIIADVTLRCGGALVKQLENVQLGLRPTRLDGILLPELDRALREVRPGERRTVSCRIPEDYERADLRGKEGQFEFTVHELKRLVPLPLAALLEQTGAESEQQLRALIRQEAKQDRDRMVRQAERQQVLDYLLANTALELPPQLSSRQIERSVRRRVVELELAGIPQSEIEARIDELRTSATAEVARDLRLDFILDRVAAELEVSVSDEELNSQIAGIARRYNRRFDRTRDELQKHGLLERLAEQIRQDKCLDELLRQARVVEAGPQRPRQKGARKAGPKAVRRKTPRAAPGGSARRAGGASRPAARQRRPKKAD